METEWPSEPEYPGVEEYPKVLRPYRQRAANPDAWRRGRKTEMYAAPGFRCARLCPAPGEYGYKDMPIFFYTMPIDLKLT